MFTKNRLILILGLWIVFITLYGGFPRPYDKVIYIISGLAISTLSFLLARHKRIFRKNITKKPRQNEVYTESARVAIPEQKKEEIIQKEPELELEIDTPEPDTTKQTPQP